MFECRLQVEVQVEVDPGQRGLDAGLVEQRSEPLVLLSREDDGGAIAPRRETRERARLANQRLAGEPTEVADVAPPFPTGDSQARPFPPPPHPPHPPRP